MEITDLAAQVRKEQKKGPSRRLREKGFVPAVFYGRSAENILLSVKNDELIIAQVAYKGIIDLMVAGHVKTITPALLLSHSKMIQATAKALKDGKGIEENPLS